MNPVPVTTAAAEINRLHEEAKRGACVSRQALHGALVAAWQAGGFGRCGLWAPTRWTGNAIAG